MIAIFILYTCTIFAPLNLGINRYSYNQISAKKKSLVLTKRESAMFFLLAEKGLYFNRRIYEYGVKVKLI